MPSSRSRRSASISSPSRIRSPALSCATRSTTLSHSGVAYSGWLPTSRYRRAPLRRNTLLLRPHDTTRRNRYRATSSGDSRRCPRKVHVTPYSFSSPKIRRSTLPRLRALTPVGHYGSLKPGYRVRTKRFLPRWVDVHRVAACKLGGGADELARHHERPVRGRDAGVHAGSLRLHEDACDGRPAVVRERQGDRPPRGPPGHRGDARGQRRV